MGRSLRADWHFRVLPYRMRTAVLVTKTDHCLNEILWRAQMGELPVEITSIIGNRTHCKELAKMYEIPFHHIEMDGDKRENGFREIHALLQHEKVELTVLARFMQILPDWFCAEYQGS